MVAKKDHPWQQVIDNARKQIERGAVVFQKWTCAHCGLRQEMEDPNTFYENGQCEKCGKITSIKEHGHNFILFYVAGAGPNATRNMIHHATGKVVPRKTDA